MRGKKHHDDNEKIKKEREKETFKGATSRITQLEKAGKFFQVCHS